MKQTASSYQAQATSGYRYGFNGKELDKDFGSNYDYGFRIYNPSIAKFLSVDPLAKSYPWYTPYQFAGNMPIEAIDLDGLEPKSNKEGFWEGAGKAVLEGAVKTVKYVYNNPNHAGYGYSPNMKPPTQQQINQYTVDWSQQLDPYYQIEAFSENAVMGPINMYQGVVNKDGRQFVSSVPQVAATFATFAELRALSLGKNGPKIPLRDPSSSNIKTVYEGFTQTESKVINEVKSILSSKELNVLNEAYQKGIQAEVTIGGRTFTFEPDIPTGKGYYAMTNYENNSFHLGGDAFQNQTELTKTLLWEIHRIETTANKTGKAINSAANESKNAQQFSEAAYKEISKGNK